MAFAITKSYAAGDPFMEADMDNFRSALLTWFNTTKFSAASFSGSMALTSEKFTAVDRIITTVDASPMTFGDSSDATLGTDASKNLVFDTASANTEIQFLVGAGPDYTLEFFSTKLNVPGDIIISEGGAGRTILQALSSYKKPVLEWQGSSDVSIQNNTSSQQETVLFFPTFVAAVEETPSTNAKYRQAKITAEANGYGTSHTGAASGGRRVGVSLTTNAWYYVYACKLRSGTNYDADTAKFVLVFDTTAATPANHSTLDGYYGEGCWLYLGLIRYGYGEHGSVSSIIKFKYSNKGWCYFYGTDGGAGYGGLALAYSTANADDTSSFYTLASGTSGDVVPDTVGHLQIALGRAGVSDWTIKDSSGDVAWRGGYQTSDTTHPHGFQVEIPFVTSATGYKFCQTRKGTGVLAKYVVLTGFVDTLMAPRRQGHGI